MAESAHFIAVASDVFKAHGGPTVVPTRLPPFLTSYDHRLETAAVQALRPFAGAMKRPAAKVPSAPKASVSKKAAVARIKKPSASAKQLPKKKPKAAPKKQPKEPKDVSKSEGSKVSLRILYLAGGELLQLTCPATWTTTDVRAAVNQELSRVQAEGRLEKLVHVGGGVIPDGKKLAEAGLQHGAEIYAVLYQPLSSDGDDEEEEECELYDGYSDYELDDDLYDVDHTRPAMGEWDACIHGCGNRGSSYYGGECRSCYDEH
eukprot:s88_g9.t1